MSSISLSLKMMLAASACAGLTLLACGDDATSGGDDGDKAGSTKNDAGSKRDAGRDAGRRDAGIQLPDVTPGDECDTTTPAGQYAGQCEEDQCDSPPCYARCLEGVYTDCKSQSEWLGELLGDGGIGGLLRDGGLTGILGDAGLGGFLGDSGLGGILGDAGPIGGMCEAPEVCTSSSSGGTGGSIIGLVAPAGQGICTEASGNPKACEAPADCEGGGSCLDVATIPGAGQFAPLLPLIGFPAKFCMLPCKP